MVPISIVLISTVEVPFDWATAELTRSASATVAVLACILTQVPDLEFEGKGSWGARN